MCMNPTLLPRDMRSCSVFAARDVSKFSDVRDRLRGGCAGKIKGASSTQVCAGRCAASKSHTSLLSCDSRLAAGTGSATRAANASTFVVKVLWRAFPMNGAQVARDSITRCTLAGHAGKPWASNGAIVGARVGPWMSMWRCVLIKSAA